jgi:integrase
MASQTLNFTKVALSDLVLPAAGKRAYYRDEREKGLILDVKPSGTKTFYLYKKIDGKPERLFLGQYPDMSIENARKAAATRKGEIAQGQNPQDEKRNIRNEITFGELFTMYLERHSKLHKKSWKFDEREFNKYLSHWFKRKISDITRNEVHKLHSQIGKDNGIYQANRILERVRGIYNKAIEWGWEGTNPAHKLKKFREKSRERFLSAEELPRFFDAVQKEENETARDFFLIALFTGARKTNTLMMRWNEIDLDRGTWRIPDTKNGESQLLPLSIQALDILKRRHKTTESIWVFSGNGKAGYFQDPKKAWKRILERGEFEDLRIHDLRRTLGSWQAASGVSLHIIGKTLGHKSASSTQVYARLDLDPVRASLETATNAMFALGGKNNG